MKTMHDDRARSALSTQARAVCDVLERLAGELSAAADPHRRALRLLEIDALGHPKRVYQQDAFQIWTDLLKTESEDVEAAHHLAIMHHARAFDLEDGSSPDRSNADWEGALAHWSTLWKNEEFWLRAVRHAHRGEKRDDREEARRLESARRLRHDFAFDLLRVHFDIALDEQTLARRFDRAKYHVKLALSSSFPDEIKADVRRTAYEAFVKEVPEAVWNPDTLVPEVIKKGTDRIEKFLEVDPDCWHALSDLLRLLLRQLRATWTDLHAIDAEARTERLGMLHRLRDSATAWRPYLDRLASQIDRAAGVEQSEIRSKLCLWYRVMGMVHADLERYDEALALYAQGAGVGSPADEETIRCRRGRGEVLAQKAAALAQRVADSMSGKSRKALSADRAIEERLRDARTACDDVRRIADLSMQAVYTLAQAYTLIDQFETAIALCRKAIDAPPDDAMSHQEAGREGGGIAAIQKLLRIIEQRQKRHKLETLLSDAKESMADDDYPSAVRAFDEAARIAPDLALVFFLRSQCYLHLNRLREARADLETLRDLASEREELLGLAQLEAAIGDAEEVIDMYGAAGRALRKSAIEAFNEHDYRTADDNLEEAIGQCPKKGRRELEKERAMVLTEWANAEVRAVMENGSATLDEKERTCQQALGRLETAHRLDASRSDTVRMLTDVRRLLDDAAAFRAFTAKKKAMIDKYGTEAAFKLQQQAIAAFNADGYDQAAALLRQALTAFKKEKPWDDEPAALKEELSIVLNAAAVAKVSRAESVDAQRRAAEEARLMLAEAVRLHPENLQALDNLSALR